MTTMMKCGHAANAVIHHDGQQTPCCVICYGIDAGACEPADPPDLSGRKARCPYCKRERDSSTGLPFFEHRPQGQDSYYCGCMGWD